MAIFIRKDYIMTCTCKPDRCSVQMMWRVVLAVALVAVVTSEPLRYPSSPVTVLCPDKMGTCPSGSTCCQLVTGRYGCCSFPQVTIATHGLSRGTLSDHCDQTMLACMNTNLECMIM